MFLILHFFVASLFHKQPSVVMSVLEREEMDRQLDSAKTELFVEQRRARERLESMQEVSVSIINTLCSHHKSKILNNIK